MLPTLYLSLGIAALSFLGGWQTHSWKIDSEITKAYQEKDKIISELQTLNKEFESAYLTVADKISSKKITIVKEKIIYVPEIADSKCVVNNGAVWMWNNSTKTDSVAGPGSSHESGRSENPLSSREIERDSEVKLSEVIETGALNNQTGLLCIERLKSLQAVIREYQKKTSP